jgi:signal transduction histidine kinase
VRIDNDAADEQPPPWAGSGRGLKGLREHIQTIGGELTAGPTPADGWTVKTRIPVGLRP